jgi:site-specific DNA-methyltransferase (adenine-specific)
MGGGTVSVEEPYYTTPCGSIRIYHARWEDVLAVGAFDPREVKLIHADPPYGVGSDIHRPGVADRATRQRTTGVLVGKARHYPVMPGNMGPFDPAPLLAMRWPLILWGANHYSDRLPGSPSWIVWDKRDGTAPDDGSDAELAWTNMGGALRTFRHAWRGLARASETGVIHLHPTQKPEALSAWVFQRAKLKRGDLVLVPYMGSGPDLRPALAMGLRVIACEVEELYCRTAVNARLRAVAKQEAPEALGPLFGGT